MAVIHITACEEDILGSIIWSLSYRLFYFPPQVMSSVAPLPESVTSVKDINDNEMTENKLCKRIECCSQFCSVNILHWEALQFIFISFITYTAARPSKDKHRKKRTILGEDWRNAWMDRWRQLETSLQMSSHKSGNKIRRKKKAWLLI